MKRSFFIIFLFLSFVHAKPLQKEGSGYLEIIDGQRVLHVQGTPYEMGYQHGKLLKDLIEENVAKYIDNRQDQDQTRSNEFVKSLPTLVSHLPKKYIEEMKGLSEGSKIAFDKILILNLFPEMFHCSAITAANEATLNGNIYHVRVLDYAVGKGVQNSAVLIVGKPKDGYSFVNISYAGFIGSVSGMNEQGISLGEIGGGGYGHWDGMAMSFIMREMLEKCSSLDDAKHFLENTPRTCEYFYIVADGKTKESFGAYTTPSKITFTTPGTPYGFFLFTFDRSYGGLLENVDVIKEDANWVNTLYKEDQICIYHKQPENCLALVGSSYKNYPQMVKRINQHYGSITEKSLMEIIKSPVARKSNLHNVIFSPCDGTFWVAHASHDDKPACDQPYHKFNLFMLLYN